MLLGEPARRDQLILAVLSGGYRAYDEDSQDSRADQEQASDDDQRIADRHRPRILIAGEAIADVADKVAEKPQAPPADDDARHLHGLAFDDIDPTPARVGSPPRLEGS